MAEADSYFPGLFPGGVIIAAADLDHPPDEQSLTWRKEANGALIAQVYGWHNQATPSDPGTGTMEITATAPDNGGAIADLAAQRADGSNRVYVEVLSRGPFALPKANANTQRIILGANGIALDALHSDSSSDFLYGGNNLCGPMTLGAGTIWNTETPISVPLKARQAVLTVEATGYVSAAGLVTYGVWWDDVHKLDQKFYFNQVGVHTVLPRLVVPLTNVQAGVHNVFLSAVSGSLISDSNDVGSWTLTG